MVQGSAACPLSGARTAREGGDGRRDGTRAISTHRMVSSVPPDTHSCAAAATQRTGPLCAGAVTSCARGRVRTYRHIAARQCGIALLSTAIAPTPSSFHREMAPGGRRTWMSVGGSDAVSRCPSTKRS